MQSKKGGNVNIDRPSQHVLERTSVLITPTAVECRFTVNLPAMGMREGQSDGYGFASP